MKSRRLRLLLALYPRAWRRRYGDEFAQLLDDLQAEQPGFSLRRTFDVLLGAGPVQLAWRPAVATPLLVFVVFGAMASVWVTARVSATTQQVAISSLWTPGHNVMIIRGPHSTSFANSYATRKGPHGTTIVRIRAISRDGRKVTVFCRAGKCHTHPRR